MSIVNVTIDWGDVDRGFDAMERRGATLGTVFQALKRPARQDLEDHARRAMGHDGPWPRLSVATAVKVNRRATRIWFGRRSRAKWAQNFSVRTARINRSRTILKSLPKSVRISNRGNDTLVERSAVDWAGVHNTGGTAGHGARQPRREFLWFSERFLEVMTEAIEIHVIGGWDPSIRLQRLRLSL